MTQSIGGGCGVVQGGAEHCCCSTLFVGHGVPSGDGERSTVRDLDCQPFPHRAVQEVQEDHGDMRQSQVPGGEGGGVGGGVEVGGAPGGGVGGGGGGEVGVGGGGGGSVSLVTRAYSTA